MHSPRLPTSASTSFLWYWRDIKMKTFSAHYSLTVFQEQSVSVQLWVLSLAQCAEDAHKKRLLAATGVAVHPVHAQQHKTPWTWRVFAITSSYEKKRKKIRIRELYPIISLPSSNKYFFAEVPPCVRRAQHHPSEPMVLQSLPFSLQVLCSASTRHLQQDWGGKGQHRAHVPPATKSRRSPSRGERWVLTHESRGAARRSWTRKIRLCQCVIWINEDEMCCINTSEAWSRSYPLGDSGSQGEKVDLYL